MSLICKRKSTGPNTDPCGTPNVMFDIEDLQFLTETYSIQYDSPVRPIEAGPVEASLFNVRNNNNNIP